MSGTGTRSGPAGATAPARRKARSQASGASARRLSQMKRTPQRPQGVRDERDRAAQRPGRRNSAGAPQGAEPSERSERPARNIEGNEQSPGGIDGGPAGGHRPPVPPALSIVIPTLDAAGVLGATLADAAPGIARLGEGGSPVEVVVADGGSRDGTADEARRHGARLVEAAAGRGRQLAAGAAAADGAWLLFLHADTRPAPGWHEEVSAFIAAPANRARAAVFRFALDDRALAARLLERLVALRCRLFALPYGDQGLLIHRGFYDALGGFRPLPLMEDVDLARRIGRRRLTFLATPALTSAVRYRRAGYGPRMVRNLCCLTLFSLGVRAETVARLYG